MTLHMYFRLMAAMFDIPVALTSESIHTSPTVMLDPENARIAVGISLLSLTQADIYAQWRTEGGGQWAMAPSPLGRTFFCSFT